jgi:hypothetical protein
MTPNTFQINIKLSIDEANALARIAENDLRSLRDQTRFILREALIARGVLIYKPELTEETQAHAS